MACLGHANIKLIPEKVIKAYVDCPWCGKTRSRVNHQPLPEGILKERIEKILESKGMCEPCAAQKLSELKAIKRMTIEKPAPISPRLAGILALEFVLP